MAISRVPDDLLKQFTKMALNMPASGMQNQINLSLCGPPGNGKSSTGNSILNKNKKDKDRFEDDSETTCISWGATNFGNYKLKVFDSPPAPREKTINAKMVMKNSGKVMPKLLKLCPKGFHAVLIVVKYGHRLYQEEEFVVPLIKRMFGEDFITKHAICVVTNGDMFRKVSQGSQAEQDFHSWCRQEKTDSVLGRIFQTCCYRCVLFDNFTEDARIRTEQVRQLMSMVTGTWPQIVTLKATIPVSPTMRVKADIRVLIETAANPIQFQQQLEFAIKYNSSFKSDSKMSFLIVGATDHLKIGHGDFKSDQDFTKALLRAPYLEPCESTENALAISRQETFSSSAGQGGENKQLLVMVTQGVFKNEEKATQEADQLKSSGTQIMVVAVASVSRHMVASLASDQDSVFVADNYDELPDVALEVATNTVEKDALLSLPHIDPCESTENALELSRQYSFHTTANRDKKNKQPLVMSTQEVFKNEEKATQESDHLKRCFNRQMFSSLASEPESVLVTDNYDELLDEVLEVATKIVEKVPYYKLQGDVLFILDSLGSISPDDYQRELDFALELIDDFNIGPTAVRFSVMIYSSQPKILFQFSDNKNHGQIRQALQRAPHFKGGTDTAAALDLARTTAFDSRSCARETRKKIAVLITNGHSDDRAKTARAAKRLKNSGVLTLAVGVGVNVDRSELKLIANSKEEVYMVGDFRLLQTIKDEIAEKLTDYVT